MLGPLGHSSPVTAKEGIPDERENSLSLPATKATRQLYWFSQIPGSLLIPRCVLSDKALLLGARMLWGVIRQRSFNQGVCTSSYSQLAAELGCKAWAARKYCRALVKAGLLETTQRNGSTPVHRLLPAPRFADAITEAMGVAIAPGGQVRTHRGGGANAPGHIRNEGSLQVFEVPGSITDEQLVSRPRAAPGSIPPLTDKPEKYFTKAERDAIRSEIQAVGLDSTGACIATLARKAKFYGATGFEIGAAISRAWRKVQRKPSNHPQKIQWIFAVVEAEFSQRFMPDPDAPRTGKMVRVGQLFKPSAER